MARLSQTGVRPRVHSQQTPGRILNLSSRPTSLLVSTAHPIALCDLRAQPSYRILSRESAPLPKPLGKSGLKPTDSRRAENDCVCPRALHPLDGSSTPIPACPIYHLHGDRDWTLPFRYTDPNKIVAGGGHVLSLTHPGEVNAFVKNVLSQKSLK
jgi:pimeloyl-ACP methyl ester carboxylesterase